MTETSRSRTPEEIALLEAAARTLPGGVLGSARFPDDVAFIVKCGASDSESCGQSEEQGRNLLSRCYRPERNQATLSHASLSARGRSLAGLS